MAVIAPRREARPAYHDRVIRSAAAGRMPRLYALTTPRGNPELVARVLGIACVLLIVSSEFKFRVRDTNASLQGHVDSQVLVELAIYGAVGAWILTRRLLAEFSASPPTRRLARLSALRVMRVFSLIALVTSAWSPTSIAPVRALQYVIAVELAAEIVYVCSGLPGAAESFWRAFSVALVIATVIAVLLTLSHSFGFTSYLPTYQGVKRFRLLAMHPIATADILGLVAIVTWEPLLRARIISRSRSLPSLPRAGVRWLLASAVIGALVETHERTSTLAGIFAVVVLLLSPRARGRAQVAAICALGSLTVGVVFFSSRLIALALRGQTTSDVAAGSGRNQILSVAWHLFTARPFTGWGYLSGRSVYLPIISWAGESHDVVAEVGVSFGIFGILLFGFVFARWWHLTKIGRRSAVDHQRLLAVRSTALVLLVLVIGAAADSFAGPPGLAVITLLVGLAFAEMSIVPIGDNRSGEPDHAPQDPAVS